MSKESEILQKLEDFTYATTVKAIRYHKMTEGLILSLDELCVDSVEKIDPNGSMIKVDTGDDVYIMRLGDWLVAFIDEHGEAKEFAAYSNSRFWEVFNRKQQQKGY